MAMTTEDWVITTNVLVAVTSVLVAGASEHDAVKAMSNTVISLARIFTHNNPLPSTDKDNPAGEESK